MGMGRAVARGGHEKRLQVTRDHLRKKWLVIANKVIKEGQITKEEAWLRILSACSGGYTAPPKEWIRAALSVLTEIRRKNREKRVEQFWVQGTNAHDIPHLTPMDLHHLSVIDKHHGMDDMEDVYEAMGWDLPFA